MTSTLVKGVAVAAILSIAALALPSTAEAGRYRHYRHHHSNGGAAVAAGVAGLAVGVMLGGALARDRYDSTYYEERHYGPPATVYVERRYYRAGPPPPYAPPARVAHRPAPWSPDWYAYCHSKYRSFDRRSGTYQPYHGPRRLCR